MGIWHETYIVQAGSYESIYVDMPPTGLGAAWGVEPVGRRGERAAERLASGAVWGRRRPGLLDGMASRVMVQSTAAGSGNFST